MSLSTEQKNLVAAKLADGAGIADIQRLIVDDFKIHMTYMQVRFLMDDLNLDLAPPPPPEPEPELNDDDREAIPAEAELVGGAVTVEIDKIKRPGAALSGDVTFSDGVKAKWYVDPHGRLGLDTAREDYQPSPEDIENFQLELQRLIQGPQGF